MQANAKKAILIVDDSPDNIAIIDEILKPEYRVMAATNGEDALAIARGDAPPDLILLDVMMPGMDGFEVCRRLKEDSRGAAIPVIFLTAKAKATDERMGFELGAVDYIRKPVEPDIVKTRIKTHLAQKEEALGASELRYRRLFETMNTGIMIVEMGTGIILDVNPALVEMIGSSQEAFMGETLWDLEFLRPIVGTKERKSALRLGEYVRYKDRPLETSDGRRIFVECMINSYQMDHREMTQLNLRDITALVEAERERDGLAARLEHYLSTSPTITYALSLKDGAFRWQWVSENIKGLLGYTSEEALSPDWWFRNVNAADRAEAMGIAADLAKCEVGVREYRFPKKDRSVVWLRDEMRLVQGDGLSSEIVGTLTDITERQRAYERLESALHEKGELLREIHHRVNNNMQVIIGLLNISAQGENDEGLRGKFGDIIQRLYSMASIHQQFYESDDISRIDFGLFLRQLLQRLKVEFPQSSANAAVTCETGQVLLNLEQAIPAGLIVSELLTNALKFAFADGREGGAVMVTQRLLSGGKLEIEVRDNGVGLPVGLDPKTVKTPGMMLIHILSEQLGGDVEFHTDNGTEAILRFPIGSAYRSRPL